MKGALGIYSNLHTVCAEPEVLGVYAGKTEKQEE